MPQGLQIWDETGIETFNSDRRYGRIIGSFTVSSDGQMYVPEFERGVGFVQVLQINSMAFQGMYEMVTARVEGATLVWERRAISVSAIILYGIY